MLICFISGMRGIFGAIFIIESQLSMTESVAFSSGAPHWCVIEHTETIIMWYLVLNNRLLLMLSACISIALNWALQFGLATYYSNLLLNWGQFKSALIAVGLNGEVHLSSDIISLLKEVNKLLELYRIVWIFVVWSRRRSGGDQTLADNC